MSKSLDELLPPFPKQRLISMVLEPLLKDRELVLIGPSNWGKSAFLNDIVLKHPAFNQHFDNIIFVDLFVLRMNEPVILERELIRWVHKGDEGSYIKFIQGLNKNERDHPLRSYFSNIRNPQKTLLVVDHLENLSANKVIKRELKLFRELLREKGIAVLWSNRAASCSDPFDSPYPLTIQIPSLESEEIAEWLSNPIFRNFFDTRPQLIEEITMVTGNLTTLVRDFGMYFLTKTNPDDNIVKKFMRHQSGYYSRSCHYILKALRNHPDEIETWKNTNDSEFVNQLWLSGAFYRNDNRLYVASKLHNQRLSQLINIQNLLRAGAHLSLTDILKKKSEWHDEVIAELLVNYFLSIENYQKVLYKFIIFLKLYFGFEASLHIRDVDHPLIWNKHNASGKITTWLLDSNNLSCSDYITAIYKGRRHMQFDDYNKSCKCLIPLVGYTGSVDLIIEGKPPMRRINNPWSFKLYLRRLWHMTQALRLVLASATEGYVLSDHRGSFKRITRNVNKISIRADESEPVQILQETGCSALAILSPPKSYNSESRWIPWTFITDKYGPFSKLTSFVIIEQSVLQDLNRIANDPSARGLVLSPRQGKLLFPSFYLNNNMKTTLFIKPLRAFENEEETRLLALFVFCRENNPVLLDGFKQQFLSIISQRLGRIAYLKRLWREKHDREIELLKSIGTAMPMAIIDWQKAIKEILEAIRQFFAVEIISLHDVFIDHGVSSNLGEYIRYAVGPQGPYQLEDSSKNIRLVRK